MHVVHVDRQRSWTGHGGSRRSGPGRSTRVARASTSRGRCRTGSATRRSPGRPPSTSQTRPSRRATPRPPAASAVISSVAEPISTFRDGTTTSWGRRHSGADILYFALDNPSGPGVGCLGQARTTAPGMSGLVRDEGEFESRPAIVSGPARSPRRIATRPRCFRTGPRGSVPPSLHPGHLGGRGSQSAHRWSLDPCLGGFSPGRATRARGLTRSVLEKSFFVLSPSFTPLRARRRFRVTPTGVPCFREPHERPMTGGETIRAIGRLHRRPVAHLSLARVTGGRRGRWLATAPVFFAPTTARPAPSQNPRRASR